MDNELFIDYSPFSILKFNTEYEKEARILIESSCEYAIAAAELLLMTMSITGEYDSKVFTTLEHIKSGDNLTVMDIAIIGVGTVDCWRRLNLLCKCKKVILADTTSYDTKEHEKVAKEQRERLLKQIESILMSDKAIEVFKISSEVYNDILTKVDIA